MPDAQHYRRLERMYLSAPTNRYYRPEIRIGPGEARIAIPVRDEFFHAASAVHGSVYFKAMDDAAFFALNSLITDVLVLTVSFNVYFTRPIREGTLTAAGRAIHVSRKLLVGAAELTDGDGRAIGRGSGTYVRSRIELSPDLGYA